MIFAHEAMETPIFDRNRLMAGNIINGPAILTEYSSTVVIPPFAGARRVNTVIRNGTAANRPAKFHEDLNPMDEIRIETPGGGGYGKEQG